MSGSKHEQGARAEFLVEAGELVESLSRDLLVFEESTRKGQPKPELVSDLFRAVHTLKGLSGMFGLEALARAAHLLEDVLDDLRLGRIEALGPVLDVLFEGVEACSRLVEADEPAGSGAEVDLDALAQKVERIVRRAQDDHDVLADYELEPSLRDVLTEYEEHRLRSNLAQGVPVYRLRVRIALEVIDQELERIKESITPLAEILSLLPSSGGGVRDELELEVLLASSHSEQELRAVLGADVDLSLLRRRRNEASPELRAPLVQSGQQRVRLEPSPRSGSHVVRVDIHKLDHLMNLVGELGTVRASFTRLLEKIRTQLDPSLAGEAQRLARSFGRRLGELQESVLDVRMVPLSQVFEKVAVQVRRLAREQGKDVRLLVTGSETELDKLLAEELADPLVHLVRNAIDHGVESAAERRARGKPESASLRVHAAAKGNSVVIELSDDGRGIDPQLVRNVALQRGLVAAPVLEDLSARELVDLIFLPGFTTRREITDLSGRGVGMDVVKTNITRLGGVVVADSEVGKGTTVTITLPITLAIVGALLFSVRGRRFALPMSVIEEALRVRRDQLASVEGRPVLSVRGATLPLCFLAEHLRLREPEGDEAQVFVIVVRMGTRRLGLVVDRLSAQQNIVIKGLGRSLKQVRGIAGATDLGDEELVLVLDAAAIVDEVLASRAAPLALGGVQ